MITFEQGSEGSEDIRRKDIPGRIKRKKGSVIRAQ